MQIHFSRLIRAGLALSVQLVALAAGAAQSRAEEAPLDTAGKLRFHVLSVVGPKGFLETTTYTGTVHTMGVPDE